MEETPTYRIIRDAALVVVGLAIVLVFLNIRIPLSKPKGSGQPELRTAMMQIGDKQINVELAESPEEQEKGLSFRTSMGDDEGMLFIFPSPQPQSFWMYGMNFPLDMVFIRDGKVVDYEENVPAPAQTQNTPAVVTTLEPADMILEINAGKAKEWDIGLGTEVSFETP